MAVMFVELSATSFGIAVTTGDEVLLQSAEIGYGVNCSVIVDCRLDGPVSTCMPSWK